MYVSTCAVGKKKNLTWLCSESQHEKLWDNKVKCCKNSCKITTVHIKLIIINSSALTAKQQNAGAQCKVWVAFNSTITYWQYIQISGVQGSAWEWCNAGHGRQCITMLTLHITTLKPPAGFIVTWHHTWHFFTAVSLSHLLASDVTR